ncbi:Peptidase S8 and S53 subtilisin kexin sedolisin [Carbonactinospora thermoautotrophica]|uniref:Peptidase S8 and S53 subtilisin kexin sedolisin n=1 Tax=Carbonactinospora thermoautotrophica TaxID=1469144 RepID=A0A132MN92_9ACTN|nr:Peptidase S8 and S53 subtilisin kexin sedolisin [Carbonactinospora thermoautotrophica]
MIRRVVSLLAATAACVAAGVATAPGAAADRVRDGQWALQRLEAEKVWRITRGEGVTVAVIDSGVDANHPDLIGQVLPGADFVDGRTGDGRRDLDTEDSHGTGIAAIIAGRADDASGVAGLAPGVKILPIRATSGPGGFSSTEQLAKAVRFAADKGARVINVSLATTFTDANVEAAYRYALEKDAVVVAGAGNDGDTANQILYPAGYPGVVAVSAVDVNGKIWPRSQHGKQVVLAAPGVGIYTPSPNGKYASANGTSAATAYVSAAAALVRARYPHLTAGQVINRLIKTAHGAAQGWDEYYGYGIVYPYRALTADIPDGPRENPLLNRPGVTWPSGYTPQAAGDQGSRDESSAGGVLVVLALAGLGVLVLVVVLVVVVLVRRSGRKGPPPGPPGTPGGWGPPPGGYPQAGAWAGQSQQQPPPGWGPPRP